MDTQTGPQPGLTAVGDHVVGEADTATALGSGDLRVLATPRLLAWLEAVTCAAVESRLTAGRSSVGTRIVLEHLAASPVGARVRCEAELRHVDGRLLRFDVQASDASGAAVARGEVTRVVVDEARFLARTGSSSARQDGAEPQQVDPGDG